jgi:diaminopropionate ammonia-lyase
VSSDLVARPKVSRDVISTILGPDVIADALLSICAWPEYAPSPVLELPGLARRLGLGRILVKDESARFGLGGVKALGAPYGLEVLLRQSGLVPGQAECAQLTAVAATDGNHGLALAWAARRAGCKAQIYVGRDVNAGRVARIRDAGAGIVVIDGTYDDAVLAAENAAERDENLLVTDTDYFGNLAVTRAIMAGYAVLGDEAGTWLQRRNLFPDCVFLQCGVGGMAAGVSAGLWQATGKKPSVITVESGNAACIDQSIKAGKCVAVPGTLETRMVGLSCGRPSLPAFDLLKTVSIGSVLVDDPTAEDVQSALSSGAWGDVPLATGDTGIAGIAGLCIAAENPELRKKFALGPNSVILTVNSEGPLPPEYL